MEATPITAIKDFLELIKRRNCWECQKAARITKSCQKVAEQLKVPMKPFLHISKVYFLKYRTPKFKMIRVKIGDFRSF